MKPEHLSAETLEAMAAGEEPVAEVALRALQHLGGQRTAVCTTCQERLQPYPPGRIAERAGRTYTEVLARNVARVRDLAAEHRAAHELLEELIDEPSLARAAAKLMSPRFSTCGLGMVLIDQATAALPESPEAARSLAFLAVVVAERVDPHRYADWATLPDDLLCAGRATLADALRAVGELGEAEEELALAEAARSRGSGGRHHSALLQLVRSKLLLADGRAEEARETAREIEEWSRRDDAGRADFLWEAIQVAAQAARHLGQPLQAADELHLLADSARGRAPWEKEHRVRLGLLGALVEAGGFREAWTELGKLRMLSKGSESPVSLAREGFWEGRILRGLERHDEAAGALGRARDLLAHEGHGLEALQAALYRLEVLGESGRHEALEAGAEALPDLLTVAGLPGWGAAHLVWALSRFWQAVPEQRSEALAVARVVLEQLIRQGGSGAQRPSLQ